VAVALDTSDVEQALAWGAMLAGRVGLVKVGLELLWSAGTGVVTRLREQGHEVFMDVKLHDIPATVAGAARALGRLDPVLVTAHAGGGRAMLEAGAKSLSDVAPRARLAGVTVLTSLGEEDLESVGVTGGAWETVLLRARLAVEAGCGAIVCSPLEVAAVRSAIGGEALIVTPGIRSSGTDLGDQRRTLGPAEALAAGADVLVVGRPITRAQDPVRAAEVIVEESLKGRG